MGIFSRAGLMLRRQVVAANTPLYRMAERQLLLQAREAAITNRGFARLDGLHAAEFCAFSQWGEDGIIDWLVGRLPEIPGTFVEFGVEDYRESNTRLLLLMRNWRGLVLDGSPANISEIRSQELYWRHDLTARHAFVDRDNINTLIAEAGFGGPLGLLSVDIDGNDYWVWQAVDAVSPVIVVCEYNAVLGDRHPLTVPYRADFQRTSAHYSNLYFGASIKALILLGRNKGYTFVGTTSTGCNAFFVRNDFAPQVLSALDGIWAFPSAVREARGADGSLQFTGGRARQDVIANLPLVNVEKNADTRLGACTDAFSQEWLSARGARL